MLTEAQIQKSFRLLFENGEITPEKIERGFTLLDELRPESPLRHRLMTELEELQLMQTTATKA